MNVFRISLTSIILLAALLLAGPSQGAGLPPYQALLVADNDLSRFDDQGRILAGNDLLTDVVALCKLWAIPFRVMNPDGRKFDEQLLQKRDGLPSYGVIIWCANRKRLGRSLEESEFLLLKKIASQGVGFIDPGGFLLDFPDLHTHLWSSKVRQTVPYRIREEQPNFAASHFVSRTVETGSWPEPVFTFAHLLDVPEHLVLGRAGSFPFLVSGRSSHGRHLLIRPPTTLSYRKNPVLAHILRRSILWSMGYGLFRHYPFSVILRMDDPGAANPLYLKKWNFASLSQLEVEEFLLRPLRQFLAHANIFMTPGTVLLPDDPQIPVTVQAAWSVPPLIDRYGTAQDFPSLWKGIDHGVRQGLLSVHSHGLTHMNPDLAAWRLASDRFSNPAWFKEFQDRPHKIGVARPLQEQHLAESRSLFKSFFATPPLVLGPPGDAITGPEIREAYTYLLAARHGFALGNDKNALLYLNHDKVIRLAMIRTAPLAKANPLNIAEFPAVLRWHDRDLRVHGQEFLHRALAGLHTVNDTAPEFLDLEELAAIMHTRISSNDGPLTFHLSPDPQLARFSLNNPVSYDFQIIDELAKDHLPGPFRVMLDQEEGSVLARAEPGLFRFTLPPLAATGNVLRIEPLSALPQGEH